MTVCGKGIYSFSVRRTSLEFLWSLHWEAGILNQSSSRSKRMRRRFERPPTALRALLTFPTVDPSHRQQVWPIRIRRRRRRTLMSEPAADHAHLPGLFSTADLPAAEYATEPCAEGLIHQPVQLGAYRFDPIKLSSEIIREALGTV